MARRQVRMLTFHPICFSHFSFLILHRPSSLSLLFVSLTMRAYHLLVPVLFLVLLLSSPATANHQPSKDQNTHPVIADICAKTKHRHLCIVSTQPHANTVSNLDPNSVLTLLVRATTNYTNVAVKTAATSAKSKETSKYEKMSVDLCLNEFYPTALDLLSKGATAAAANDKRSASQAFGSAGSMYDRCEDNFMAAAGDNPLTRMNTVLENMSSILLSVLELALKE